MTDTDPEAMTGYGLRIGREMLVMSEDALRSFDAAAITHSVALARPRSTGMVPRGDLLAGRTMRLLAALLLLGVALAAALWAATGQRPAALPVFAPGALAFSQTGNMVIATAAGTDAEVLAAGTPDEPMDRASFSPDGRHLAFVREGPECQPLFVADANRTISGPFGCSGRYAWAPDGQSLAVYAFDGGVWHLVTIGLDGHAIHQFPDLDGFTHDNGGGWTPSWSPDGRWIAIAGCATEQCKFDHEWMLIAADGSGAHWLHSYVGTHLAWSRDSCLATVVRDSPTRLQVLSTSGHVLKQIDQPDPWADTTPSWSPDGTTLVGVVPSTAGISSGGLGVAGLEWTSTLVVIDPAADLGSVNEPRWSVDGARLVFTAARPTDDASRLWSVALTGGSPELLADSDLDGGFDIAPAPTYGEGGSAGSHPRMATPVRGCEDVVV